ncbi:MAG: 30S ribosomal protein S6 [Gemmatimonadota bacterium]
MRDYEVVYIFDTTLDESTLDEKLERFNEMATTGGGEVTTVDRWGSRPLAYPISKKSAGNFVVVQFRAVTDALPEFERSMQLDDDLLRYLIVLHEGEPSAPMSIAHVSPRGEDDEDEDGEGGEGREGGEDREAGEGGEGRVDLGADRED